MSDSEYLFNPGDVVEHKMNTDMFGIVIGFMGSLVGLRISRSLDEVWFHEWELRAVEDDEYEDPEHETAPEEESKIIDFTKARAFFARCHGNKGSGLNGTA